MKFGTEAALAAALVWAYLHLVNEPSETHLSSLCTHGRERLFNGIVRFHPLQLNSMLNGLWLVRQLSSRRDVQRKHQSARQMVYLKNEKLIYIFLLEECLYHEKGNCDEGTRCESTEQVICGIIS